MTLGQETSESSEDDDSTETSEDDTETATTAMPGTTTTSSSATTTSMATTSMATTTTTTYATQNRNDLTSNYLYESFDSSSFAYAVGQCTRYSILQGLFMKATCLDMDRIQMDIYSTAGCDDDLDSTIIYTAENGTFNCSGVNAYAEISINLGTCPGEYTVYSALNTCAFAATGVYSSVYCMGTDAEIQYYLSSTCSDASFYDKSEFNNVCGFLFTSLSSGYDIYGNLTSCYIPSTATTTSTVTTMSTTPSSANSYNINNVMLAVALFFVVLRF